jgi:hypothetical protein
MRKPRTTAADIAERKDRLHMTWRNSRKPERRPRL